jgi:hypothetical protein
MTAKLTLLSQNPKSNSFFKFIYDLTNYRIFIELFFSQINKMADLFKMVEIWTNSIFFSYS